MADLSPFISVHSHLITLGQRSYGALRRLKRTPLANRLNILCCFASQLIRHPRKIGAICPSSQELATKMASLVPDAPGLVVEIGAGTGAVTQALLDRGLPPDRLLLIEHSSYFCEILRRKFPRCTIIHGDAARLDSYLPEGARVSTVVSSLPLMNLSKSTRKNIMEQVHSVVDEDGCVIQFTYAWWMASPFAHEGYRSDTRAMVVRNLPPARVDRFKIA